jgi:hypothetical protein
MPKQPLHHIRNHTQGNNQGTMVLRNKRHTTRNNNPNHSMDNNINNTNSHKTPPKENTKTTKPNNF